MTSGLPILTIAEVIGDPRCKRYVCRRCGVIDLRRPYGRARSFCKKCADQWMGAQRRAVYLVYKAIRKGLITKAEGQACVDCNAPACELDHRDYGKPLEVVPVCRSCNARRGPAIWPKPALTTKTV